MTSDHMNSEQLLSKLAKHARQEEIPCVDVTQAVLGQLSTPQVVAASSLQDSVSDRIWATAAACAILAASITFMLGSDYLSGETEPVFDLLQTAQVGS